MPINLYFSIIKKINKIHVPKKCVICSNIKINICKLTIIYNK